VGPAEPAQSLACACRGLHGWPLEEGDDPAYEGHGRRQTGRCRFAEAVPGAQVVLPFLSWILALKETEARQA